jgi:hypothetical protein
MLTPIIAVVDIVLWCIQGLLMLVFVVPLQRTAQALTWASWKVIHWPYYRGVVRLRRRITGRPLWQESDAMIGIPNPSEAVEISDVDVHLEEDTK